MNEDYNSIEPGTDLGLGVGYSDQYSQGTLTKKSGVGANAGSLVDMKYVASDSLSELVWSPHKGLSLRCAGSSSNDRKSSILWDAGPNNASFILPLQAEIHLKNISEGKDTLNRTNSGVGPMTSEIKMHTVERGMGSNTKETESGVEFSAICFKQKEDLRGSGGVDIIEAGHIPMDEVPAIRNLKEDPVHINRINKVSMKQVEPELDKVQHELSVMDPVGGDSHKDGVSVTGGKNVVHALDECKPSLSHPAILGKLESSAENDLQNINAKTAGDEGSKILLTGAHEVRGRNQQDEKNNCKDRDDSASPPNSRMHWKQKEGKEKALSDGDMNGRMSNDEDNSYGSVESSSGASLSTCKRRWSFEQQLTVGSSKRVKKHDNRTPGPTSNLGQDSSFMNWISNLIRGFAQSIQDETPSLDLSLTKPDIKHGGPAEEPVMYKKSHDPGFHMGFQSIFRSLYGSITRGEEGGLNANCQTEQGAKEIEVINKSYDINATPIACFRESDNFGKQPLLMNENVMEFTTGNGATQLVQPKNSSEISCGSHHSHKTRSQEKRNSCNLVIGSKVGEVISISSLGKSRSNSTENVDCDRPCVKTNYSIGNTSDPYKSLWITRFAAKTPGLMLNPENCNQNTEDDSHISCPQNLVYFHHSMEDLDTAVSKEQCYTATIEASPCQEEYKSNNEQKSISKFNPVLPFPSLTSSEAIASVFARRLGAFKHIIPSDVTENAGHETVICFFCGTRGHRLQDCAEITGREVEDLSRNISLCNDAVELPCFCIKCFELNHWAIACPIAASKGQQQSESRASLADHCDIGETQLNSGIGLTKPQFVEKRKLKGVASMLDDNDGPNFRADLRLDCKVSEEVGSAGVSISKCVISRFSEESSKETEMVHADSLVDKQNSDIPQVVFNAVKKLRLSRNDVLKCMNSQMSLSHLDGFFLRVRLGKLEEGLGGTGYHVACIRGVQLAKNSISVIVRGIECQVQSQYISNHDFLEDELMAWWCAASKDNSKILPLAADLSAKVENKRHLGF